MATPTRAKMIASVRKRHPKASKQAITSTVSRNLARARARTNPAPPVIVQPVQPSGEVPGSQYEYDPEEAMRTAAEAKEIAAQRRSASYSGLLGQ